MNLPPYPPTVAELLSIGFTQDKFNHNLFTRHDGEIHFGGKTHLMQELDKNENTFVEKILREIDNLRRSKS